MKRKPILSLIAAATALLGSNLAAHAATPGKLFAIGGFDPDDTGAVPHRIYEIDPATGKATPMPASWGPEPAGLAATADGRLLALDIPHSHGPEPAPEESRLLEIDPFKGFLTKLATVPTEATGFDIFPDGRAFTIPLPGGTPPVQLHAVNLATGALTPIGGASAIDDAFNAAFGSAPAANKRATQLGSVSNFVYAVVRHGSIANLVRFDPTTGAASVIGASNAVNTSGGGAYTGIPGLSGRDSDGDGQFDELYGVLNYHDHDTNSATPLQVIGALIKFDLNDGTWSIVGTNPGLLFSGLASTATLSPTPPSHYLATVIPLDSANYVAGEEINESGIVAVGAYDAGDRPVAARFHGTFETLAPLTSAGAYANSINDAGRIVGWALDTGGLRRPVAWSNGVPVDLGTLGGDRGEARGVNNTGQIVGQARNASGEARAFLWSENIGMVELPMTLGGNRSAASAVNQNGVVAGSGRRPNGKTHAVRFDPATSTLIDLGTLGGDDSFANGINDAGEVAGLSDATDGTFRPFFWSAATGMLDLFQAGHLGSPNGAAYDVNAAGEVVGYGEINEDYDSHAFLWTRSSGLVNLNQRILGAPNLVLAGASGINDAGQITGWGNLDGRSVAFLLDPVIALDRGETDIGITYVNGEFDLHIHHEVTDMEYAPRDVLLRVAPHALSTVSPDPAYAFLGQAGAPVYLLPQVENTNLLFLGLAAEEIQSGTFTNDRIQLALKSVAGPGHFALYTLGVFGEPTVLFNTRDGIDTKDVAILSAGLHQHANWAFSAPGLYRVTVQSSGILAATGEFIEGEEATFRFEVMPNDAVIRVALVTPEQLQLSLPTQRGLTYQLESAPSVTGPWTNEGAPFPGTGGAKTITVPLSPGAQFFRIQLGTGN